MSNPIDCTVASVSTPVVFPTKFSDTGMKGWYVLFRNALGTYGNAYSTIKVYYDDNIYPTIDDTQSTTRTIDILRINHAPVITDGAGTNVSYDIPYPFVLDPLNFNGTSHVDGSSTINAIKGSGCKVISAISDSDASSAACNVTIQVTDGPGDGSFSNIVTPLLGSVSNTKLTYYGSLGNIIQPLSRLQFKANNLGKYTITVTVSDNGNTGLYCPPGNGFVYKASAPPGCPRTSVATIYVSSANDDALVAGATVGAAAGVLALAALGALIGGKLMKPKETDAWMEWDDDKLGDVALKNPFYEQATQVNTSQIYGSGGNGAS